MSENGSEQKVALVTGGGTGIGAACCAALAAEGFRVGVHYRSSESTARALVDSLDGAFAVRTNPDAPKHAGISIVIVPTRTPGVTIRPLHTMYGGHTNETFYDDVRVPVENTVGEVDRGWPIVMHALNHERVSLAATGALARLYDQLVAHLREHEPARLADPVVRRRLADLCLRIREHRTLALHNAWIISRGGTPVAEASMAKISGTELRTHIANVAMDLLGRSGGLAAESGHAPCDGRAEFNFRLSPIFRFGGGTNEIMRDIVAAAGLGLAR